jgi:hypothetical protein
MKEGEGNIPREGEEIISPGTPWRLQGVRVRPLSSRAAASFKRTKSFSIAWGNRK